MLPLVSCQNYASILSLPPRHLVLECIVFQGAHVINIAPD